MGGLGISVSIADYGIAVVVPEEEEKAEGPTVPVPVPAPVHNVFEHAGRYQPPHYDDDVDDEQWRDENFIAVAWVY